MPSIGGSLGELFVRLGLKTDDLDKGAEKAKRSLFGVRESMREVRDDTGKLAVKVGALGAALVGLVYVAGNTAREIMNLARVSNTSTREFQRNAQAARTVGVENQKLADIYKSVNDRVGDFIQTGAGPMADFFEKIAPLVGVTAEQFERLSGPDALELYVKSLEAANLSQQEMTFYMEKVASDSTKLLPLLRNGAGELRALGDAAEEAGRVLSDLDLQELEDARNRIDDLKSALGAEFMQLIADNADGILDLAEKLGELAIKAVEATTTMLKFFGVMKEDRILELSKELLNVQSELFNAERSAALRRRDGDRERIMAEERIVRLKEEEARITAELLRMEGEWRVEEQERQAAASAASSNRSDNMRLTGRRSVAVRVTGSGSEGEDVLDAIAARRGAITDAARERLDVIRDSLKSEEQLELDAYARKLETLEENRRIFLGMNEEFDALEEDLEQQHQDKLAEIRRQAADKQRAMVTSTAQYAAQALTSLTSISANESKKQFEQHKKAQIAQAVVNTWAAASQALAAYPPPVSFAMAAAAAAAGLAQVQGIRSSSFGGGGGTPGGVGGGGSGGGRSPTEAASHIGQVIQITGLSRDSLFSGKAVRELLEQINEAVKDGGRVVFS